MDGIGTAIQPTIVPPVYRQVFHGDLAGSGATTALRPTSAILHDIGNRRKVTLWPSPHKPVLSIWSFRIPIAIRMSPLHQAFADAVLLPNVTLSPGP